MQLLLKALALDLEHRTGIKKAPFVSTIFNSNCKNVNKIPEGEG